MKKYKIEILEEGLYEVFPLLFELNYEWMNGTQYDKSEEIALKK